MKIVLVTFAAALLAAPVFAAGNEDDHKAKFQKLDTDSSTTLSQEELQEKGVDADTFSRYDINADGVLSEDEFVSMKKDKKDRQE